MSRDDGTQFWNDIESEIRPMVKLLRENGFNTTCSCGHDMTVEITILHTDEAERMATMLVDAGFKGFRVDIELAVPTDGLWDRRMTLQLNGWLPKGVLNDQT